jgi:RinA family phage transcriptional activator
MSKLKVPAWLKAAIEEELKRYPITRLVISEAKRDIIDSTHSRDEIGVPLAAGSVSDPTFAKAAKLSSKDIVQMEWICQAISDVYSVGNDERKAILTLFYFRRLPHYQVAEQLGMSESTLWRARQEIIRDIAYRMGVLKPTWKWFRNAKRESGKQDERILKGSGPKTVLS